MTKSLQNKNKNMFFYECETPALIVTAGLVLVTDAIMAMGLPSGEHHLGNQKIHIDGKRATIAGTDTLCGRFVLQPCGGLHSAVCL